MNRIGICEIFVGLVILLLSACFKVCYKKAYISQLVDPFHITVDSTKSTPTHRLINGDNGDVVDLFCIQNSDIENVYEHEECTQESTGRTFQYRDMNGDNVLTLWFFVTPQKESVYLFMFERAYLWWYSDIDFQDSIGVYGIRRQVEINQTIYSNVIPCHDAQPEGVGSRRGEAYINFDQGAVAIQDSMGVWWNIIALR